VLLKRFAGSNGEGLKGKPFEHRVQVIPSTTVLEIATDGTVTLMDQGFRKSTLHVDSVVLASVEPEGGPYEQLVEAGLVVVRIGDAARVRNLRAAVTEGANAGLTIDDGLMLNANRALVARLSAGE
jgi:hypothetical protein